MLPPSKQFPSQATHCSIQSFQHLEVILQECFNCHFLMDTVSLKNSKSSTILQTLEQTYLLANFRFSLRFFGTNSHAYFFMFKFGVKICLTMSHMSVLNSSATILMSKQRSSCSQKVLTSSTLSSVLTLLDVQVIYHLQHSLPSGKMMSLKYTSSC
jgi:hypothetical protein